MNVMLGSKRLLPRSLSKLARTKIINLVSLPARLTACDYRTLFDMNAGPPFDCGWRLRSEVWSCTTAPFCLNEEDRATLSCNWNSIPNFRALFGPFDDGLQPGAPLLVQRRWDIDLQSNTCIVWAVRLQISSLHIISTS